MLKTFHFGENREIQMACSHRASVEYMVALMARAQLDTDVKNLARLTKKGRETEDGFYIAVRSSSGTAVRRDGEYLILRVEIK